MRRTRTPLKRVIHVGRSSHPRQCVTPQWSCRCAVDEFSTDFAVAIFTTCRNLLLQESPQISRPFRVPPQVTGLARHNLPRWRHGFKSRWDYGGWSTLGSSPGEPTRLLSGSLGACPKTKEQFGDAIGFRLV
jgi:hypothetical protein